MFKEKAPEWTAKNRNRKKGDTTFIACGWCEHVSGSICQYGCALTGSCSLMKDYGEMRDVKYDTLCTMVVLGDQDRQSILNSKRYEIGNLKSSIKRVEKEIKTLKWMKLDKQPPLAENRGEEFKLGSVIYTFLEDKQVLAKGIVVSGYRSGDGCVSYVLNDFPKSKEGWGCGCGAPIILKEWEFEYFKNNLDTFKLWLSYQDREYNGNRINMDMYYKALKEYKL